MLVALPAVHGDDVAVTPSAADETPFNVERRAYPDLIPPGQGSASAWMAVWDEGMGSKVSRPKGRGSRARSHLAEPVRNIDLRGVPVDLETLFSGGRVSRDAYEDEQDMAFAA